MLTPNKLVITEITTERIVRNTIQLNLISNSFAVINFNIHNKKEAWIRILEYSDFPVTYGKKAVSVTTRGTSSVMSSNNLSVKFKKILDSPSIEAETIKVYVFPIFIWPIIIWEPNVWLFFMITMQILFTHIHFKIF